MLEERIARAKELLSSALHIALATVNADGLPHNSPLFFGYAPDLSHIYWGTNPKALHSQNLARTGRAFGVLYEATIGGGLYMYIDNVHILEGEELDTGLAAINAARQRCGRHDMPRNVYINESPQRMYGGDIRQLWVNVSQQDAAGFTIDDTRVEIRAKDLL